MESNPLHAGRSFRQGANRRQFLSQSSLTVAGMTIAATSASIVGAAHPFGDDTIKVGLVGCGGRGSQAADQALSTEGKVKLVAVGDAFRDRIDSAMNSREWKRHGDKIDVPEERKFVGFDAYKQVLETDCDLVILATPPGFRPIHFEAAVEAGKHVFMEKPVAVDAPGVRKVLAAAKVAKEKELGVGVGLQRRHEKHYIETIDRIHNGEIGDVLFTRVYWNNDGVWVNPRQTSQTEMEYQMRNWYYFNWICGDHIVEQHIHNLDVSNWVKNMVPASARGTGGREVRKGIDHGQIYDHHFVEYTYPDGSTMMSMCRHHPGTWSLVTEYAHGSKGWSHVGKSQIYDPSGETKWRFRGPTPSGYQAEHDDLFASIRKGKPYNEAEFGATSTMTAILGRMATYSGHEISWDEALASEVDLSPEKYAFDAPPPVLPNENGAYPTPNPGKNGKKGVV
jgi:myo-inositol 2-dehydrogenase / D-chiro-inositol 1-dehydrogenase